MKKTLSIASVACLALVSCHHSPTCSNTVTITDGNSNFLECNGPSAEPSPGAAGPKEGVIISLSKSKPGAPSNYMLSVYSATSSQFVLDLRYAYAPSSGTGLYLLLPQDSTNNTYTEFIHGKSYKISGGTVNITSAGSSNVTGTFTLNVFNASDQRTISGTINANQPYINY